MKIRMVVLSLVAAGGCGILGEDCTTEALPALIVSVEDSVSGGLPLSDSIVGVAADGAFADTVRYAVGSNMPPLFLALERSGTYRVDVYATGYATWSRQGVHVGRNECHVEPVRLSAKLVP